MRSQIRLRVVLPVLVLGLLGLGVAAFALTRTPAEEEPAAVAQGKPAAKAPEATKPAAAGKKAGTKKRAEPAEKEPTLAEALKKHQVVVVLFYSPDSAVDRLATREARAGADAVGAGFLAIDVSDGEAVASLATRYDVREAPALLVFTRGPQVVTQISGYVDRETVAQAAENAFA